MPQGFLLFDFRLTSKDREAIKPENIWLRQGKDSKVISGVFLSRLEVSKEHPVLLGMTVLKSDLNPILGIEVSIKGDHEALKLEFPVETLWK